MTQGQAALRIGITGSTGMMGWQLRCFLNQFKDVETPLADRATFADAGQLREFVSSADAIVHFAGQNRGDDNELAATNVSLAEQLIAACEAEKVTPHIVYSSTIHIDKDNAYGRSKKAAGDMLAAWSTRSGARLSTLVLPHVFGEGTRPFYNSVAATFAYQIAKGETPSVHSDAGLELLHAQDVAAQVLHLIRNSKSGAIRPAGAKITVSSLLARLQQMAESYERYVVPDVRDPLDLRLFNLYRSYLFPDFYPRRLERHSDERGDLVEIVKNLNGGQAFVSTTRPGITRGNHYHYHKIERFLVVQGSARIAVRKMFDSQTHIFDVVGSEPAFIDMPPMHTHNITNTGNEDLLTMFWAHEVFDPERPDTVFEIV